MCPMASHPRRRHSSILSVTHRGQNPLDIVYLFYIILSNTLWRKSSRGGGREEIWGTGITRWQTVTNDSVSSRLVNNPSVLLGRREFGVCIPVPRQVKNFSFIGGDNGGPKTKNQFIVSFSMPCFDKASIRLTFFTAYCIWRWLIVSIERN
jgi:hypothetical protein